MKTLEFETSKGRFLLIDNNQDDKDVIEFLKSINYSSYVQRINLKQITELQASEIVDLKGDRFQDYNHVSCCDRWCNTAIESLHSILKSKGVHLFENINNNQCGTIEWQEDEVKTFYKPYIFKL